jgi:prolyl-tRNA synthetase
VRPTSETIIWDTYKDWIKSYRDLPLLINQWANVVRWELRTRLFLRTTEFLWQEGHTAHATKAEAVAESRLMLDIYEEFVREFMAVPVYKGEKTPNERFAGAEDTYTIEALMQDGKALQAGTSHFLGQNFSKAFDVTFLTEQNKQEHVWATSWGVSTRLMGALIMSHSDDDGLVLPPRLAPLQVVIIPIPKPSEAIDAKVAELVAAFRKKGITVKYDNDTKTRPGFKFAEYELQGVPVRLALGARDLENNTIEVARRDTKEKYSIGLDETLAHVEQLLVDIQDNLYHKAWQRLRSNTHEVKNWEEFLEVVNVKTGFAFAYWDGTVETELKIKELTQATARCIPFDLDTTVPEGALCVYSGKPATHRVLFAKAY